MEVHWTLVPTPDQDGIDDDDTSSSMSGSVISNSRSAHSTGSGSKLSGTGSGTASSTNYSGYSNGGFGGNSRLASGGKRTILNFK
ncbi:unnamed protein product [Ambrosiozyma monospora]|uniref:Unnamed protein product n=1 Tax=Ambrosiozyma monospora TaxID=43982 RepID=A0ACB5UCN6_AMBMO|nr:unnamed protein product [Ambrosiozyma monospora]